VECCLEQDTPCVQQWIATVSTDGVCNIQGKFEMQDRVLCRDSFTTLEGQPGNTCNFTGDVVDSPNQLFDFKIGRTSLCDEGAVDTGREMTYTLTSFFDEFYLQPTTVFQTGDRIFFQFVLTNPLVSIDRISFNQIIIKADGVANVTDTLYSVSAPFEFGSWLNDVEGRTLHESRDPVPAGEPAILQFTFRLHRAKLQSLLPFLSNDQTQTDVTVGVTVDIAYHGNGVAKRETLTTSTAISKDAIVTILQGNDPTTENTDDKKEDGEVNDANNASSVYPVSFAVVALFALFVNFF